MFCCITFQSGWPSAARKVWEGSRQPAAGKDAGREGPPKWNSPENMIFIWNSLCWQTVLCPNTESTLQARAAKAEFPSCNSLLNRDMLQKLVLPPCALCALGLRQNISSHILKYLSTPFHVLIYSTFPEPNSKSSSSIPEVSGAVLPGPRQNCSSPQSVICVNWGSENKPFTKTWGSFDQVTLIDTLNSSM